jgi:hypothetical protein
LIWYVGLHYAITPYLANYPKGKLSAGKLPILI